MKNEIVRISLGENNIESIYAVKLAQGDYLNINTLNFYTQAGITFFYVDCNGVKRDVEIVDPVYKDAYIHTMDALDNCDPILNLATY